jgi:hypothetical protein
MAKKKHPEEMTSEELAKHVFPSEGAEGCKAACRAPECAEGASKIK